MNSRIWKEEQSIYINKVVGGKLQPSDAIVATPPPTRSSKTLPLKIDLNSVPIQEFPSFLNGKPPIYKKVKAMKISQIRH